MNHLPYEPQSMQEQIDADDDDGIPAGKGVNIAALCFLLLASLGFALIVARLASCAGAVTGAVTP